MDMPQISAFVTVFMAGMMIGCTLMGIFSAKAYERGRADGHAEAMLSIEASKRQTPINSNPS